MFGLFESFVTAPNERFKVAWEDELGAELSDETCDRCLTAARSCSVNSRHQLIQFKVIHCLYYTKTKLHKMFSSVSPFCDKCKVTEDTTARAFWFCPSRSGFWTSIFDWYSKAYNRPLLLDTELAIFGFSQHTSSLPNALQQALTLSMIVAKRLLLKNWKSSSPPSFWLWTVWYGNSSNQDCKALQRVVRLAERISGSTLPSLQDIYLKRCKSRAAKIIKDSNHPGNHLFRLLPSGKHFRSMMAKTERLRRSFFPQAIRLLNTNSVS